MAGARHRDSKVVLEKTNRTPSLQLYKTILAPVDLYYLRRSEENTSNRTRARGETDFGSRSGADLILTILNISGLDWGYKSSKSIGRLSSRLEPLTHLPLAHTLGLLPLHPLLIVPFVYYGSSTSRNSDAPPGFNCRRYLSLGCHHRKPLSWRWQDLPQDGRQV